MDNRTIRTRLEQLAEEDYRQFQSRLLPGTDNLLGVRLPALRRMAREICRGDWRTYLAGAADDSFEEIMLQGMVIGAAPADIGETLELTRGFLPKINNWSVCDSFCAGLKTANSHPREMWEFILPCLRSTDEYTVRFGAVMLLTYYLDGEWGETILPVLGQVNHPGYYAKMAVAWAVSLIYIRRPEQTLAYLQNGPFDDFTRHRALRKIAESRLTGEDTRKRLRAMERPGHG